MVGILFAILNQILLNITSKIVHYLSICVNNKNCSLKLQFEFLGNFPNVLNSNRVCVTKVHAQNF